MRIFKYLFGIWAAVAIYAIMSFISGPKGIAAYNHLLAEKERQWNNIRELGILNEDLERTRNNLIYDHDTLLVQAHQMGYGHENERFIRIVGLSNIRGIPAEVGTVYFTQKPDFFPEQTIKIAALIIGFLIFAFLFMLELIERRAR